MKSLLTNHQTKTFGPVPYKAPGYREGSTITAEIRYDDRCHNGHNTFSITGEIREPGRRDISAGGCLHDEIADAFPELEQFLKWHLMSSDGPMHYVANTLFWLGYEDSSEKNLKHARICAVCPDLTEDYLASAEKFTAAQVAAILEERLPTLLATFKADVESLGFVY